jgi:hypothetical protein
MAQATTIERLMRNPADERGQPEVAGASLHYRLPGRYLHRSLSSGSGPVDTATVQAANWFGSRGRLPLPMVTGYLLVVHVVHEGATEMA